VSLTVSGVSLNIAPMIKAPASPVGYGPVAKALHWAIVGLLACQFAIAWTMPDIGPGTTQPDRMIDLHLSFGILILLVIVVRLLWRIGHPVPLLAANVPRWQQLAATAGHHTLYLLLLLMPLLGWASASGRGFPVTLFGIVRLPDILARRAPLTGVLGDVHTLLSYVLLGVIGLHVLAALYHHFVLRDGTLRRMLPGLR
jgi:cytochrome b561